MWRKAFISYQIYKLEAINRFSSVHFISGTRRPQPDVHAATTTRSAISFSSAAIDGSQNSVPTSTSSHSPRSKEFAVLASCKHYFRPPLRFKAIQQETSVCAADSLYMLHPKRGEPQRRPRTSPSSFVVYAYTFLFLSLVRVNLQCHKSYIDYV